MFLSDLHTHTIASGHGTSCTVSDMAKAASKKGLKLLGITDHGPATLAAATPSYFRSLTFAPGKRFDVELLYGTELNLLDTCGNVDLDDELLGRLDYAIVSMHIRNYAPGTCEENTDAFINAMKKHPGIKILGHADDTRYMLDYDMLAEAAKDYGVIFEINEASLTPAPPDRPALSYSWSQSDAERTRGEHRYSYRGDTRENCIRILQCSAKYDLPVILSSDSHGPEHIGDFTNASALVREEGFPEDKILNNRISWLKAFLHGRMSD